MVGIAKLRADSNLLDVAEGYAKNGFRKDEMERFAHAAKARADAHGRVTPELQATLSAVEDRFAGTFSKKARAGWQGLLGDLGAKTELPIEIPANRVPIWLAGAHPLANFQSTPRLPKKADVLVIGAGLTGASAAYHLAAAAKNDGLSVVVLDRGDPATQASGRNGGNFELIPENFFGDYEGLAQERYEYLKHVYPDLDDGVLRAQGDRQARAILGVAVKNKERLSAIIAKEAIDADFSPKGWIRVAGSKAEEDGMKKEVALAKELGLDMEMLSPAEIDQRMDLAPGTTKFWGRESKSDGNYHPFKYVNGVLRAALDEGVKLYTRTGVDKITTGPDGVHRVKTPRGTIEAKKVIFATNAFTSKLLPELSAIEPYRSQIIVTEHAPDRMKGITYTAEKGDLYGSQPRGGLYTDAAGTRRAPMLLGGGLDTPIADPDRSRPVRSVHEHLLNKRDELAPELARVPPSREWSGPMAFTPDRAPAIGELRPGLFIAAGFNGYGGTYTQAAGLAVAELARTGKAPEWLPEDVFSPKRFLQKAPLFTGPGPA